MKVVESSVKRLVIVVLAAMSLVVPRPVQAGGTTTTFFTLPTTSSTSSTTTTTTTTSTTTTTTLPLVTDIPLAGNRIRLFDSSHPQGRRNTVGFIDPNVNLTQVNPMVTGATVSIGRLADGSVTMYDLPAAGWSLTGNTARADYKFKSHTGPAVSARLVDGRFLRFSAHGPGAYALGGTVQDAVGIIVQIGDVRFCGLFGGTITRDTGMTFLARRAPAPAACPVLGPTTTTTSTTSTTETTTTTTMPACNPSGTFGCTVGNFDTFCCSLGCFLGGNTVGTCL